MGLILPILFLGLMASLSPATIVVFVLVLGTAQGARERGRLPVRVGVLAHRRLRRQLCAGGFRRRPA